MAIDNVIAQSVQNPPPHSAAASVYMLPTGYARGSAILQPYGTRALESQLRDLSRNIYGSMFMGGRQVLSKQFSSTSWIIKGNRGVKTSQELLQAANWGGGMVSLQQGLVRDFTTHNIGAFVEVIGNGDKDKPLIGRPTGVKLLDPLQCYLTGWPETPVLYENWWHDVSSGKSVRHWHLLHWTRVHRFVDMQDSDEQLLGMGECALFRYVGHHWRQILMGRYATEKLSDQPPAGWVVLNNVKTSQFDDASRAYEAERAIEGQTVWRNVQKIESLSPTEKASVDFIPFANVPDGFDYKTYMEIDRNIAALSLGIDPQDIWPLSGGMAGTSGQSKVLHEKSRGRSLGLLYEQFTTFVNTKVIPPSAEFEFKPEDMENDKGRAERAQVWMDVALGVSNTGGSQMPVLTSLEQRQLLANTVPEIQDVVTDEDGVITLPSDDIREENQTDIDATENEQVAPSDTSEGQDNEAVVASEKAYSDTRDTFIKTVTDTMQATLDRDMNRTRFGIVMRGVLTKHGRRAYMDGLEDGGVKVDALEAEDKKRFNAWLVDQSKFVTDLGRAIYRDDSQFDPANKALLWGNKSLNQVYQKGLLAADTNAMYKWVLGSTKEHCKTCQKANGQVHRLRNWERSGIMPQSDRLECQGFHCKCELKRTTGRAVGRLSRVPRGEAA